MYCVSLSICSSGNGRAHQRWLLGLTVLIWLLSAPSAPAQTELYAKRERLPDTMLAIRGRLRQWQANQEEARRHVHVAWQCAALGPGEKLDADSVTKPSAGDGQPGNRSGGPRWTACPADAAENPAVGNAADYLLATVTADQPVTLSIELSRQEGFGGFAYRPPPSRAGVQPSDALVWLNGRQVELHNRLEGYQRVPVAKRRGWHEAVLIDLPLQKGENRFLLSLGKPGQRNWFNVVRMASNPAPVLWAMIENDFPPSRNRLLEAVPFDWFDPGGGWLSQAGEAKLEQALLKGLAKEVGGNAEAVRRRCDQLALGKIATSDPQWLNLCVTAAELRSALRGADALSAAIQELHAAYPGRYAGERLLQRVAGLRQRIAATAETSLDPAEEPTRLLLAELESLRREALVTGNPLLAGKTLLFVKRYTYDSDHYYDEFIAGIRRFGGGFFRLSLQDGAVAELAPELRQGIVDRYDLAPDGKRILLDYKPPKPGGFRVFEIGVDGRGLRQITSPPDDEEQRIAAYAECSKEELSRNPCRYGHWTDDMHPCYLPDGRIVFTSTRAERGVLCGGHSLTVSNLHRINADGTHLTRLSQGALSEFCPSVMNDGRILYNRWEYVDKGAGAVQALWAMLPDGGQSEEIYGNNIGTPPVYNQARHVPGCNHLVVCLGAGHCPGNMGAILLVDLHKNKRTPEAMTALTPGCVPKGNWALRQFRNGRWLADVYGPWYCDPFPLSDSTAGPAAGKFFLVSCNADGLWNDPAGYGIYLLDVFGNRVPIYSDPAISCWQARPLEPRPAPPALADAIKVAGAERDANEATVVVADVYQGLDGVPPGTVKYLRIMQQVPRPWSVYHGYQGSDSSPGQMVAVSLYTHLSVKVLQGIVPVHEDGSACFIVPANRNVFFQALDGDFMEVQRMRTFVNFQPGEQRACIGCHEHRTQAPASRSLAALLYPPARPQAQPGEVAPRPIHYPTDVQPIFDRHCVSCHNARKTDGNLDLSGDLTPLFCRSYENLINKDLVGYIQEFVGPKPEGADAMGYAPAVPPYTYGSHKSKLIAAIRKEHYGVKLPREDFIRLATWVDANAPYYGSYFGRRNIAYHDRPDFRPVPTLESALGIPPPDR
ncbi:MAG: hypothetical protein ABSF26_07555 [Thermoguttaceae bacterium]|jgi:hypothetical protein